MAIKINDVGAVIFDMDGSLVDSMWMWEKLDRIFMEERGIPFDNTLQDELDGLSYMGSLRYMKEKYPIKESVEEMAQIFIEMARDKYSHEVPYKPGALEFLKECKRLGIPCGMATSNDRFLVNACDSNLHFSDYISSIRTTDEVENSKPAPDCYLLVADDLKVSPEKCVVFEDIVQGIQAGKAAGMRVYAVKDDYSIPVEDEKKRLADGFIEDYRELIS